MTEEELEVIREFERVMGLPKPPPPPDEVSEDYEEYRNEGRPLEAEEPDEVEIWEAEHRQARPQEKTEQKVLHDEQTQVVHRDNELLQHDKARVYTEKPLIEEEEVTHLDLAESEIGKSRHLGRRQLIQAMKWAEILGKPKAFQ